MRRRGVVVLGAVLAIAAAVGVFIALKPAATGSDATLRPDDAATVALGAQVYTRHCAACHGARLEGQPDWRTRGPDGRLPAPPHDASGHTWHHPDEVLVRITRLGVARAANLQDYASAMPAFEGVLSDAEIVAALSWIKAQWPREVRAQHDAMNRRAQAPR